MADHVDAMGRTLQLESLTAAERFRLFRAIPNDLQSNYSWMVWAMAACSVRAIDAVPVPMPGTQADIEALVSRLDDAGIDAAQEFLVAAQAERASVAKNSAGTPISASAVTS